MKGIQNVHSRQVKQAAPFHSVAYDIFLHIALVMPKKHTGCMHTKVYAILMILIRKDILIKLVAPSPGFLLVHVARRYTTLYVRVCIDSDVYIMHFTPLL